MGAARTPYNQGLLPQMLERAAAEARARAAAARAECNPLNHPLVQGYFNKK